MGTGHGLGQGTYTQVVCPREMLGTGSCHSVGPGAPEAPSHGSTRELRSWGSGGWAAAEVIPRWSLTVTSLGLGPLQVGFFTGCHTWHKWHQPQCMALQMDLCCPRVCREAPGVVAQRGGSAMGGAGLSPLSVLACGSVSAWLEFQLVPADSKTRAAPKMGCARGCSSDGNSPESGFLQPESCRVAASGEAQAE